MSNRRPDCDDVSNRTVHDSLGNAADPVVVPGGSREYERGVGLSRGRGEFTRSLVVGGRRFGYEDRHIPEQCVSRVGTASGGWRRHHD